MAETAILAILALLAGVYAGYPLLVLALAAAQRRVPAPRQRREPETVSILICAHNEARSIGAKLESVFAAVSGRAGTEILVADDGSSDGTAAIVAALAADSPVPLRLMRFARGGKAAALNALMAQGKGEILVFSDADPLWEAGTLEALLAPFSDPQVGAVAGEVRSLRSRGRMRAGDALFRAYESAIRAAEDRLFGCVSADGGLFALRARLAEPVPPDVTDDFFLSTAAVTHGCRIAFAKEAAVWEVSPPAARQHLRRRIRITVRGLTGLWRRRALLDPTRTGAYALGLLFHKLLRRLAPLLLAPLALAFVWLALERGGAALPLVAGAAVAGLLALRLRLPLYLAVHLGGLAAGTVLFLAGRRYSQWAPQKQ